MLNEVKLIGHLGDDPSIRTFQNGGRVANLRVATTEKWKNKEGERQERTDWHTVCVFSDGLVNICERYLKKGSKLLVQGKLQTRKYEKKGQDHYATEVVLQGFDGKLIMLDGASGGQGGGQSNGQQTGAQWNQSQNSGGYGSGGQGGGYDDLDTDGVPF